MLLDFIHTTGMQDFTTRAVTFLVEKINAAIADHDCCIIGLSGGSTPKPIYEALGTQAIDWTKVHIFLIDERYCSATSDDSNQKMIRETLIKNITNTLGMAPIRQAQGDVVNPKVMVSLPNHVFPNTTLPLEECIAKYIEDLHSLWSAYLTDINILGMGDDGHIASLFPPLAENVMDDSRLVHHTVTDRFAVHDRITLSLNAVAASSTSLLLLKGDAKRQVWDDMMASDEGEMRWPIKRVMEASEMTVLWSA